MIAIFAAITGYGALPPLLLVFAGFLYVLIQIFRELLFYWRNDWDYSRDSGVPPSWVRIGPYKRTLSKKTSMFIGNPILLLVLGLASAFLLKAFLDGM